MIGTSDNLGLALENVLYLNGFKKCRQDTSHLYTTYEKGDLEAILVKGKLIFGVSFSIVKGGKISLLTHVPDKEIRTDGGCLQMVDDRFIENALDDFYTIWKKADEILARINTFFNERKLDIDNPSDTTYDLTKGSNGSLDDWIEANQLTREKNGVNHPFPDFTLRFLFEDQIKWASFDFKFTIGNIFYNNLNRYDSPKSMFEESQILLKQEFINVMENVDLTQI